ncbi:hypothetical protein B0H14DRAFT_2617187 [Mycena olivaceomarginata]|nr:hypothetical protein B0H14DRAFT_2617187 [Mycena olivaceomarginata]
MGRRAGSRSRRGTRLDRYITLAVQTPIAAPIFVPFASGLPKTESQPFASSCLAIRLRLSLLFNSFMRFGDAALLFLPRNQGAALSCLRSFTCRVATAQNLVGIGPWRTLGGGGFRRASVSPVVKIDFASHFQNSYKPDVTGQLNSIQNGTPRRKGYRDDLNVLNLQRKGSSKIKHHYLRSLPAFSESVLRTAKRNGFSQQYGVRNSNYSSKMA